MSLVGRKMQNRKFGFYLLCNVIAVLGTMVASAVAAGQAADRPWMNPSLSPEERADLVLKQLTLDEKLGLLHGNGMAHAGQWQMPLTHLADGGAGGDFEERRGNQLDHVAHGVARVRDRARDQRIDVVFDDRVPETLLAGGFHEQRHLRRS